MTEVIVSTDGSALGNPNGPMGWGWAEHVQPESSIASSTGKDCDAGGATNGTNQIGELCAVLEALRTHRGTYNLTIETDSQYAINCSTTWIHNWKRNGWKNSKKEPVKNAEIIKAIDFELNNREGNVKFVWVKGHAGNVYNEKVDDLARGFAEKCGKGRVEGYLPLEGWKSLINSEYSEGLDVPAAIQDTLDGKTATLSPTTTSKTKQEDSTEIATATAATITTAPTHTPLVDQPLFNESNESLAEELIARLNIATERFDLAAARLESASTHMDEAVSKLDEAIKRFDDTNWNNNLQDTLF